MKKIIFIFTSLIVTAITVFTVFKKLHKEDVKPDNNTIEICSVETEFIDSKIETYGTVTYKTKHDITSLVSGNVIEKKVKEGDFVKRGQILYVLKNVELEIQSAQYQNSLTSAKANVDLYKAKLAEQIQYVQSKILSIQNKEAEIKQMTLNLYSATEKYNKNVEINRLGGITDQNLKDMQDEISSIKTSLEILEREYQISLIGFSKDDLIKNGINPSENQEIYEKQIIDLNTKTCVAELAVARAEYENSQKNVQLINNLIGELNIRSCVNGIVGITNFEEGEFINQNEKVLTIIDISTCTAEINIQETDIFDIEPGKKAMIEIPSANEIINCTITDISPVADFSTGNFFVKADFKNESQLIKPGMFLKCSIETGIPGQYLKIPESALINSYGDTTDCFIIKNDLALKKNLKIEFTKDGFAYFKNGLENGQQVIDNPSKFIQDGTNVKTL